ncbi:IS982 family transposase [Dysgonomonas sp. 520]|uniref:IS982 family transposase n=1 Tax=Dysgonomonas sp. 520 TaxID=2302931 RepID=UPI0013D858A6|nr:IS982 family transposase [Dysgonomonas sp. 520]
MNHREPESRKTCDAEIITVVLIAAQYFSGNIEKSLCFVRCTGLMPDMLSKSRFNRRLHKIGELISELFFHVGQAVKELNIGTTYCIDSFPVSVCQNIRIINSKLVKGKKYHGYCASKRTYFYGFKVHMIVTSNGTPVEFTFTTGNKHDLDGLKQLPVNLPEGSELLADCAYTDYLLEEMLADNGVNLLAARKNNSKHPHNPCTEYLISIGRKRVETAFSDIAKYMPKKIHAVTDTGFLIKLIAFIWAYTFDKLYKL